MDDVLHLIGLCNRAGSLAPGEEPAGAACRARDCRLLLVAADAADNTRRRAEHFAQAGQCLLLTLPCSREELGAVSGRRFCALAAVTDIGLACAMAQRLAQRDEARYGDTARRLQEKAERAKRRRAEQRAHEKNLRTGGKKSCPYVPTRIKRAQKER